MSSLSFGMNHGSILGLLLMGVSVLFFAFGIFDFEKPVLFWIINTLVIASFIRFSIIQYRDVYSDKFISYSESVKIAVTVAVFSSFVLGFYKVILIMFIAPEYIDLYIHHAGQQVLENADSFEKLGLSVDNLLDELESSRENFKPFWIMINEIINKSLGGLLLGLIISFFTKKENLNKIA